MEKNTKNRVVGGEVGKRRERDIALGPHCLRPIWAYCQIKNMKSVTVTTRFK